MKKYPHAPDEQVLADNLAASRERLVPARDRKPELLASRTERFWSLNTEAAVECACLGYALGDDDTTVTAYLDEAIRCCVDGLAGGAPFGVSQASEQLSVALILGRSDFARTLAGQPLERYALPGVTVPQALQTFFQAYARLASGDARAAAARLRELDDPRTMAKLPRTARALADSVRRMLHSIIQRDETVFAAALEDRLQSHVKQFSNPDIANFPQGLIDLQALGLIQLARQAGMHSATDSVYLPLSLLA